MDERSGVDQRARVRWDSAVPDYDAFGREIGENTLAGLGGDSNAARAPRPEPTPAPEEEEAWTEQLAARAEPTERAEPAPRPQPERPQMTLSVPEGAPVTVVPGVPKRRGRGLGCVVGLVLAAAIVAGPVIGIVALVSTAGDAIDDVTNAIDPDVLELPDAVTPATGITGDSMLAPDNLARGLAEVRSEGFARATRVDARPDRLTVTVVKGGRSRDVVVSAEGGVERGPASPANTAFGTFALQALDPAAPARLVRGAAKRYRVRPKGINYVLAGPEPDGHHWRAYFKNGVYVEGDAKGRVIRRFD
jgi:hypothetical protein